MTFEKLAHDHLFNNGMFEEDVQKVLELAKQDETLEEMKSRWSDDTEGYPPFMRNIVIVSLNRVAVKYIDEHTPKAWYRPIFAD